MNRQVAWRVFASEYNDSNIEIKGEGEMAPSFVVTPLGAKINRLFVSGVLTDVENVSEGGDFVRAHISDPTGVFTLYSGQYQQEVTDILSEIDAPAFVGVIGKVRTYVPEEGGEIYTSIRPEKIIEINANIRDNWILETCISTKERIEAYLEAIKMEEPNLKDLKNLGYSTNLSEGIITSLKNYKNVDVNRYIALIKESLDYLSPNKEKSSDFDKKDIDSNKNIVKKSDKKETKENSDVEENNNFEKNENTVLKIIKDNEGEDGVSWDIVTKKCGKKGLDDNEIEEVLSSLMDKGFIYEPVLGTIKTT
jgi:RPA family protein